jgi:uncharacterized protein (DUF433 family)
MRKVVCHADVLNGKPHLVGTSITVATIINKIMKGFSITQIARQFPQISEDDVRTAIKFAEDLVSKPMSIETDH